MSMTSNTTTKGLTMKNAISYIRVSTEKQAKSGAGLDAQKAAIEKYAAANGFTIIASHIDAGISGASPIEQRTGLVAAVAAITKGTVLLIAKRDRLGRDQLTTLGIERAIQKKGGSIVSADGIANGTAAADQFMRSILDAAAAFELSLIKARTLAAVDAKRQKGQRIGEIPFGFSVGPDGLLIEVAAEQLVIQKIMACRSAGMSLRAIASVLDSESIPTKKGIGTKCTKPNSQGKVRAPRSGLWSHRIVRLIIARQLAA
jgi:site-specific DNA recombinase